MQLLARFTHALLSYSAMANPSALHVRAMADSSALDVRGLGVAMCLLLPVHRALKFSAVLGTTSPYRPKVILPALFPSISMSKNTWGSHSSTQMPAI